MSPVTITEMVTKSYAILSAGILANSSSAKPSITSVLDDPIPTSSLSLSKSNLSLSTPNTPLSTSSSTLLSGNVEAEPSGPLSTTIDLPSSTSVPSMPMPISNSTSLIRSTGSGSGSSVTQGIPSNAFPSVIGTGNATLPIQTSTPTTLRALQSSGIALVVFPTLSPSVGGGIGSGFQGTGQVKQTTLVNSISAGIPQQTMTAPSEISTSSPRAVRWRPDRDITVLSYS